MTKLTPEDKSRLKSLAKRRPALPYLAIGQDEQLEHLSALGLIERGEGRWQITTAGREALEATSLSKEEGK